MKKYLVFEVLGGAGKNVMATALLQPLKNKYPDRDIIIVASWPEIFLYHSVPESIYRYGLTPNFYHNYIEGKDTIVLKHDPYSHTDYITGKTHLISSWMDMYNLSSEDFLYPDFNISSYFLQNARQKYNSIEKPILFIHSNGGSAEENRVSYSWTRDIPSYVSNAVVESFKDRYHIIQVCRDKSQAISQDIEVLTPNDISMLDAFSILTVSSKRLLIDSCFQHVAASWKLPSVVLWVGTNPFQLGYDIHNNITPHVEPIKNQKLPDSYLHKYKLWGAPIECPFIGDRIFDERLVINQLENS